MKRTFKTLSLVIISVLFYNATQAEIYTQINDFATIEFETETIDYGKIEQNSEGIRTFNFTNTGNAPLLISKVKTSCGCTVPSYSKAPILPGEPGEIKIKYNTKRPGVFSKSITVLSNAQTGNKILKIKGEVIALN